MQNIIYGMRNHNQENLILLKIFIHLNTIKIVKSCYCIDQLAVM